VDSTSTTPNSPIVIESERLRVTLDAGSGCLLEIGDQVTGLRLLGDDPAGPPWRLEIAGEPAWREQFATFGWEPISTGVALSWATSDGIAVQSSVELRADELHLSVAVDVPAGLTLDKIEYPVISHLGDLDDTATPCLAHPQGTGFLFRHPSQLFEPEPGARQGLRFSPYPEGFSGSSMQFYAYYAEGAGGFTVAALDSRGMMKWLNVYKDHDHRLKASFIHQAPDLYPGNGYHVPYRVVIRADDEGSWYASADWYKAWATRQPWTSHGTLSERGVADWLHRDIGYATFGINAAADRSPWLERFHQQIGFPGFHVLGVNWPNRVTGYGRDHPGGRADWFPARLSTGNLQTIAANGDYWAPFTFDLLLALDGDDGEIIAGEQLALPEAKYSFDAYNFRFSCPATVRGYLPALSAWRDAKLAAEYGANALYYDISGNNVLMACRNPDHGHPVGGGDWMVEAYRRMWNGTKAAIAAATDATVPIGTEMVNEVFLREIDYYQARAEGGLLASFEGEFFRDWIASGDAEKIPMFAYVYHEYGPVRLDGWGKPSRESGDLFYWVAARVALWGGLFELNYEFSPLEDLEGRVDDPDEHYHAFPAGSYTLDESKLAFVRQLGQMRTGFGNPYLVYGTMLRPLALEVPPVRLDWHHYNRPKPMPDVQHAGTFEVPEVFHSAWAAPDGSIGLFFINLHSGHERPLDVAVPLRDIGVDAAGPITIVTTHPDQAPTSRQVPWEPELHLPLPPRRVVMVTIVPAGQD